MIDLEKAERAATAAAYKGAEVIRRHFGNIDRVEKKGPIDLVTVADGESERQIIAALKAAFPDHGIVAEESGEHRGETDTLWVIDPLDGTTNFAHGLPVFAVSIALQSGGETLLGVVLNPVSGEFFSAVRGGGARLNAKAVSVSQTADVKDALLVTGFSYRIAENPGPAVRRFERCLRTSRGIRRLGAAALDLCFLACGRFDGYWEQGLAAWDTAAGALIAREAGARLTRFDGGPFRDGDRDLLATNGRIHDEMTALLGLGDEFERETVTGNQ